MSIFTPADAAAEIAANDGIVMTLEPMYEVVVSAGGVERFHGSPQTFTDASKQMAKIISVHMSVMGYKQDLGGEAVTLKKGALSVQIKLMEARR